MSIAAKLAKIVFWLLGMFWAYMLLAANRLQVTGSRWAEAPG